MNTIVDYLYFEYTVRVPVEIIDETSDEVHMETREQTVEHLERPTIMPPGYPRTVVDIMRMLSMPKKVKTTDLPIELETGNSLFDVKCIIIIT